MEEEGDGAEVSHSSRIASSTRPASSAAVFHCRMRRSRNSLWSVPFGFRSHTRPSDHVHASVGWSRRLARSCTKDATA